MKLLAVTAIALVSTVASISHANPKICKFPNMGNVPIRVLMSGDAATVATPDDTITKCITGNGPQLRELNSKLAEAKSDIGPISGFVRCWDGAALSSFEIYFTNTSQSYFYMETQGRVSGTCE